MRCLSAENRYDSITSPSGRSHEQYITIIGGERMSSSPSPARARVHGPSALQRLCRCDRGGEGRILRVVVYRTVVQ